MDQLLMQQTIRHVTLPFKVNVSTNSQRRCSACCRCNPVWGRASPDSLGAFQCHGDGHTRTQFRQHQINVQHADVASCSQNQQESIGWCSSGVCSGSSGCRPHTQNSHEGWSWHVGSPLFGQLKLFIKEKVNSCWNVLRYSWNCNQLHDSLECPEVSGISKINERIRVSSWKISSGYAAIGMVRGRQSPTEKIHEGIHLWNWRFQQKSMHD